MNPEPTNNDGEQNALELYGSDLVQLAKDGKLDPVIGRDEEVRYPHLFCLRFVTH